MPTFIGAVKDEVKGFVCNALSIPGKAQDWLDTSVLSGLPNVNPAGGIPSAAASAIGCGAGFGGGQSGGAGAGATYPPDGEPEPAQCPVKYNMFARVGSWIAPLGEYQYDDNVQLISGRVGPFGTIQRYGSRWGVPFQVGTPAADVITFAPDVDGRQRILENIRWERQDGEPDNCGEPGTPGIPYPNGTGDIEYDDPNGDPQNEPYDIVGGAPKRTPDGDLVLPFEFCLPSFCLDINFNLSNGDINFNFGGEPGASPCCPPIDDMGEEDEPTEEDPPPPENDLYFAGVIVSANFEPDNHGASVIGNGIGPRLFVPRIGVIRFAITVGGIDAWTVDYPIKQLKQFVPVPEGVLGYRWDIIPEVGWEFLVTPLYIENGDV